MKHPTERTQQRTQKAGAYAALGLAGVFGLVIVYFVAFGGSRGGAAKPAPVKTGPDVRVPLGQAPQAGAPAGPWTGVRIDLKDKNNRPTGFLNFATMDPLEGHRYAVEKPEAWLYLSGGRSVFIRADAGEVYRPEGQNEPESGTVNGNVVIRLFEAGIDIQTIDPKTAPALLVMTTDSLAFESAVGELATPDSFLVTWAGGTFEGVGLSLVFNQPEARLERGEVQRNGKLTLTGAGKRRKAKATPAGPAAAGEGAAVVQVPLTAPTTPLPVPVETLYRLIGSGKVVAAQSTRRLTADKFMVMARLINNELPADAFKEVRFVRTDGKTPANAPTPAATGAPTTTAAPGTEPAATLATGTQPTNEPLVMTWEGPCVMVPLASAPPELAQDHIAARFSADAGGKVTIADGEHGIDGYAAAIEYGATSRKLSLVGTDGAAESVLLSVPASGRIQTGRIDADLATGIIRTPGAGTLKSAKSGDDKAAEQNLAWMERGEFAFQTTEQGLTGLLREATLVGGVKGDGRGLTFTSNEARATFASEQMKPEQKRPDLASVDLSGDAIANSTDTGRMAAQKIHVKFDPPAVEGGEVRPRFVRAEDAFTVERGGQRLSGNYLEARLIDVGEGKVDVGSVLARDGVDFASEKDFLKGKTEELRADLGLDEDGKRKQLVYLVGEGTFVSRDEPGREQGKVTGTQLTIDGARGRLESFGVGDFLYRGTGGTEMASIDASWTRRMIFDDGAGLIDCWGDSVTKYSPDAATRNKVDADRVKLYITPGEPGRSLFGTGIGATQAGDKVASGLGGQSGRDRAVLVAEAYGSILDREGGVNARIESRMYAAEELQKLSYIEGPSILASNEKGTIDVPGAGKFLLMDQSEAKKATGAAAPGIRDLGGDTRGVSLFEWATSLRAEKLAGGETTMVMKDGVSVVHRAMQDGQVTEIKCSEILANLKEREGSLAEAGKGMELQSVSAKGSVYAASGPAKTAKQPRPTLREMIAHNLDYDAVKQVIEARAEPGGVVTMFDPAAASPTTAAWLTWDMVNNSVKVRQPAGVAPR